MTPANSHIIQRQTVRLHLREETNSWAVQAGAGRALQQTSLLTALDTVLSAFSSTEEWIELERVEVDLGSLSPEAIEEEIVRRLPDLLRRQLTEMIPETRFRRETAVRKTGEVLFETFIYFLFNGLLPTTTLWPESNLAFENQIQGVISNLNNSQKERLKAVLAKPIPRSRLLSQFSEEMLAAVFHALGSGHESVIIRLLNQLQSWRTMLTASQYQSLLALLTEKVVQESATVLQTVENRWASIQPSDLTSNSPIDLLLSGLEQPDILPDKSHQDNPDSENHFVLNDPPKANFKSDKVFGNKLNPETNSPESTPDSTTDTVFYVRNAGVILLHPFLTLCFESYGWVENAAFKDDECRDKALMMIHFLATGEPQAAEYDLLVPKLLCEIPWNSLVSSQFELTEAEQEEGIGLLSAAIGHWSVLKNTSPDGLREGFLQREGKLVLLSTGHWELTVESKTQDILLNSLPWGIGMILLPWMKNRLIVNWV